MRTTALDRMAEVLVYRLSGLTGARHRRKVVRELVEAALNTEGRYHLAAMLADHEYREPSSQSGGKDRCFCGWVEGQSGCDTHPEHLAVQVRCFLLTDKENDDD